MLARLFFLALWCAVTLLAAPLAAADWHTFRGDNTRSGATEESLKLPLNQAWVFSAPVAPRTAWSGPEGRTIEGHLLKHRASYDDALNATAVGDRVYFGSSVDHHVWCVEHATGKPIWTFATGGPVRLAPTVAEGKVLFGSDDGYAYCVNEKDGTLAWKLRAGPSDEHLIGRGEMISRWPVRTNVTVDKGTAYFAAGIFPHEDIYVYAVNVADGKIVWKRDNISEADAGRDDLSPQGYLVVSDTKLFIPSGRSLPAALDRQTGKILHKAKLSWRSEGVVGGTAALYADGQLFSFGEHTIVAINENTGRSGHGWFDARRMVVHGDDAYVSTGSKIQKLHRNDHAVATRKRLSHKKAVTSLLRSLRSKKGDEALEIRKKIEQAKAEIEALNEVGQSWKADSDCESSLIYAGGAVIAGGQDKVELFDADTGERQWSAKIEGEARGLAVANGHLIVSTTSGKVYSFVGGDPQAEPYQAQLNKSPYPKGEKLANAYEIAAQDILKSAKVTSGFCLVVGAERGRLAFELAKRSNLKIYGIEPDADKVAEARRLLREAGLYGHRVVIHHTDAANIPYSNYFANLIVSDTLLLTGKLPGDPEQIARHLKPIGGKMVLGNQTENTDALQKWLNDTGIADHSQIETNGSWVTLARGRLPGAGDWSHQYGDSGNTAATNDQIVKGGLGVLWFGDPGPGKMVNRHEGAVGPLSVNGKLIVQGQDHVMAYDAYNGLLLWKRPNPEANRTGVFQNYNPGNLVASESAVFIMDRDRVHQMNADTGKLEATHFLPEAKRKDHVWGFVAYEDGLLIGTATIRKELEKKYRRRGRKFDDATDGIFAINVNTGKHAWLHEGNSISHRTIAIGPNRVYFIDSTLTAEQRDELLREDKSELKDLPPEEAKKAEERMKRIDARLATAIDTHTGEKLWEKAVDVTDCSDIGTGGGKLTLMYKNNTLVLCGANANGHYWKQFLSGEFKKRRLVCLSAEDGEKLWAKDANYRHRPIIVEDQIIAEPWSFDLYTGTQKTRPHPLTGEEVPWSMIRPGHHCGMLTGCPNMLMFRSGYTGFFNLKEDDGTRHFAGHRLGCWINAIPANGLVLIPEASAGCVCQFSIASSIILEPRAARRPWTIYSSIGDQTPVKRMALNLGAPGDRKDQRGNVWLAYPRPNPYKTTGLDLKLDIGPKFEGGGGFQSVSEKSNKVGGAETEWLYTSWANRLSKCTLPLLGEKDTPATYTVRLHFADHAKTKPGERVFAVKLQGQTVEESFDPVAAKSDAPQAVVREYKGIEVKADLTLELTSAKGSKQPPILSAIEVIRTEFTAAK